MRSLKSGLFGLLSSAVIVSAAVFGCAESDTPEVEPGTGLDPNDPTPLPPSNPEDNKPKDAGKDAKDASKPDAAKDAGPPPPNPGDPCTKVDEVFTKICGKCGSQKALCLAGATPKVSDYGPCENEIGQCAIGATQECGNCGTSTCSNSCNWGVCQNQPANACPKGQIEYSTAGCGAGTYRNRTCDNACVWGNFSTTCADPNNANKLTIGAVGATVTGNYSLVATRISKREPTYTSSCGVSGVLSTTTDHPYEIIELTNGTAQTAKVTITTTSNPSIYMVLAAYPNNVPPQSENDLKMCTMSSSSSLYSLSLAPNAKIVVRAQAYYSISANPTIATTGAFTFNVKTDSLL